MNRTEFQQLAELRVKEAEALLAAGFWDGAYYLAGYAVECGLKACILARIQRDGIIFDDRKFSEKCWTHAFEELRNLAGILQDFQHSTGMNPALSKNWAIANRWSESSRYRLGIPEVEARELVIAVSDPANGVLPWIRTKW